MKMRLLKIVSFSFAFLLILILSLVLLLTSSIGENLVRGWLEKRLTVEVGLPVSIGRFETNLLSRVQIDSLAIGTDSDSDTTRQTALYVKHVRVAYSIPRLWGETIALRALTVDSVVFGIALDSLDRYGIPLLDLPAPDADEASQGLERIRIDTVTLERMNLAYLDAQLPLSVKMTGAALTAMGHDNGLYSGQLTVDNVFTVYDILPLSIKSLEIAASLDSETVQIEYVRAYCAGLNVEASGNLEIAGQGRLAVTASLDGRLDTVTSSISTAYDLSDLKAGDMSAQLQIGGTFDRPFVKLDAHISDVVIEGVSIPSAMMRAQYRDSLILVDTFQLSTFSGVVTGAGSMTLDSLGSVSAGIALDDIDVASVWRLVYAEPSPYRGTVAGEIIATGQGYDLSAWMAKASFSGTGLRYLDRSVPDLKCHAILKQSEVNFTLLHGADKVHADIGLSGDTIEGTFDVSIPDLTALARFVDKPELSGSLWADGTISGAYAHPEIRSAITGSGITYHNFPVDSISAELTYSDGSIVIEGFSCGGSLDEIDPMHPPFDLDSISGSLTYACELHGPLDFLSGHFRAHLVEPQYSAYAVDSVSVEAALDGSRIELTDLDVFREELDVSLRATYDTSAASGSFDIRLRPLIAQPDSGSELTYAIFGERDDFGSVSGTFALKSGSDLSATVRGQGLWLGLLSAVTGDTTITDGEVDFDLVVDGPFLAPNATLTAAARSINIDDYRIDSVSTDMRLAHDALTIDNLTAYASSNTLAASGHLGLKVSEDGSFAIDSNAHVEAELRTNDFDLTVLEAFLQPGNEVSGEVSAALALSGKLESPRITGWLSATRGRLLLEGSSEAVDSIEIALSFSDSVLTVDSASCTVADLRLSASGSLAASLFESVAVDMVLGVGDLGKLSVIGMASDTNLQLNVSSDSLDLAVFQPFMTEVDSLSGTLGCRMYIVGKPAEPLIDGSLRLSALSLQVPGQYMKLSDGQADARFDRNRVILDSASAFLNDGRILLSGTVSHTDGELVDIAATLEANNLGFQDPNVYAIVIDSAVLNYGRQNESYVLGGDILLGEARLTKGLRLTSILPWVQSVETVDLELPDLIARSRLDVRIRESDQLWVDNNLARIRLRAELEVIGTPLRPNFTGMLKVEEGYLLYLDRRFQVNQGVVYFSDPARFNPDIDLDASTQIKVYRRTVAETYTVHIRAEGVPDQLQYELYSEPALDKPDIVALLTLGATRAELAGNGEENGQGGLKGVLADRVSMLTSQKVSGYLSRKAGSFFGFDEFTIQGNLFQFDDSWGPQLVASKRLSRRVDLTYSTTVGHLNDQTVRLGYRLTPRISLQGETDRQGRAGLDLKYGITFK